jgi:hypothetical protein
MFTDLLISITALCLIVHASVFLEVFLSFN